MRQIAALSFDGGGPLALSELFILQDILERIRDALQLEETPLAHEHFDMIGGSGTGGIIALLLGRLRLSVDEAIKCFISISSTLSNKRRLRDCRTLLIDCLIHLLQVFTRVNHLQVGRSVRIIGALKTLLKDHIPPNSGDPEEKLLEKEPACYMFVCALPAVTPGRPVCFRNFRPRKNPSHDCKIWEAAYATIADRSHPAMIGPEYAPEFFVDASSGFSNPVEIVVQETTAFFSSAVQKKYCFVSLGAGNPGHPDLLHTSTSCITNANGSQSERTADWMARWHDRLSFDIEHSRYFRLSVEQGLQQGGLADWIDPGVIASHTKQYLAGSGVSDRIDEVVAFVTGRYSHRCAGPITSRLNPRLSALIATLPRIPQNQLHLQGTVVARKDNRFYLAMSSNRPVLIHEFCGEHAQERRDKALQTTMQVMHPQFFNVFGISDELAIRHFILLHAEHHMLPAESQLANALEKSDTPRLVHQGISLIASLAAALQFLNAESQMFCLPGLGNNPQNFVVFAKSDVQFILAFTPNHDNVGEETQLDVSILQNLCSEIVTDASIMAAERYRLFPQKNSLVYETEGEQETVPSIFSRLQSQKVPSINENSRLSPPTSKSLKSFPASSNSGPTLLPPNIASPFLSEGHERETLKAEPDRRILAWQKTLTSPLTLSSVETEFNRLARQHVVAFREVHQPPAWDYSPVLDCPGYRRDEIKLSLLTQSNAIIVLDEPHAGELCKACGKEHLSVGTESEIKSQSTAGLFALVIGINDYQYTRKLSGCVADAQDIVSYLTKHLAVPMNHITTLFNEEANRTHILENLQAFAHDEFIAKNSPILIYYAGHGARAVAPKDWEVDERDRQIQMILPWDFNPQTSSAENEQGIPDITLRSILDNLAEKKGNNITVILDSSHSVSHSHGDGTDSYHATSRDVKLPETYTILPSIDAAICPGPRLEQVSLSHQNDRAASHVLLAACSSGETAKEENGRGRFTSALMQYLRDPKTLVDTTTYDQVVQALNIHGQTPRSEGFHSQQYLFNGMVRSAGCILHPIRRNRRGEFIMNAGEAHGINPGTVFSILPENDPSSLAVGEFVVTDTSLHFFYTVISTRISMPPIAWALQRYGGYQLSIKFQSSGEGIADEIISQLKTTCVQDSKKRFLLTFDDGHCELSVTSQNGSVVIEITDEQCRSAGLRYLPSLPLQCDKVYPVLNAAYQFFWHLRRKPNHEDVLPVELEAWQLRTARRAAQRMPIGDNLCREGVIRIPINSDGTSSAYFGYKIVNLSEEDLFVWMFSYNFLDLSIRLLHKPSISSGEPDPCLRSGGVLPVGYGSSGTGPRTFSLPDGQDIDVTYLKVFLSTKYIDLSSVVAASRFSERRTVRELDMGLLEGRWDTHCVLALQERRV